MEKAYTNEAPHLLEIPEAADDVAEELTLLPILPASVKMAKGKATPHQRRFDLQADRKRRKRTMSAVRAIGGRGDLVERLDEGRDAASQQLLDRRDRDICLSQARQPVQQNPAADGAGNEGEGKDAPVPLAVWMLVSVSVTQ